MRVRFGFEPTMETCVRVVTGHAVAACLLGALPLFACGSTEPEPAAQADLGSSARGLQLDPDFDPDSPIPHAAPADDYTSFEADPVRPVAVIPSTGLVAIANTTDDFLDLARPTPSGVRACGAVKVGMRPVAVAVVRDSRDLAELWVVNHLSDSVSVVHVDPRACVGEVVDTLYTGDEPRDVVVARNRDDEARVFVTSAHRGQRHPLAGARLGSDLVTNPQHKADKGLADVLVFDPDDRSAAPRVVNLFTDTPRALAVGDGVVYAAGFRTGNRTTVINADRVTQRGAERLLEILATDASGEFIERDGELELAPGVRGTARMRGGVPAVAGSGRCVPDPRPGFGDPALLQVCVQTDSRQRVLSARLQREGAATPECQCTSGDGTLQPTIGVIVQFFERRADCGSDYRTFPDGARGCWLDATPGGFPSPAAHADDQAPPMAWNDDVAFSLPDQDVFEIDVDDLGVRRAFPGVGTVLSNMAVQPGTGRVFVTNTEALNLNRFAGFGGSSSSTLLGHMYESRVTVIDPRRGRVQPVHLNTHIDYERCCAPNLEENERSLALPAEGVFSADGGTYYFAALGSDKVGIVSSSALARGFDNRAARSCRALRDITLGTSADEPTGPIGLALDPARRRLYVKTHISNELIVIDTRTERVKARLGLHDPEPESIRAGRQVLYDTRETSSHGDSACGTCHTFGDTDNLTWDLGNPDDVTVRNPGPFVVPPELAAAALLGAAPINLDSRANKGPMHTQTMRGMANHGPQHWRGDRMRNFQDVPGVQPNFGTFDEDNSFSEFDGVIPGLHGNDRLLAPELFQHFTDFSLQLTLPPNPLRALDGTLDAAQARGRATYFGCASMTDEQFARRECVALDGGVVDIDAETAACACAAAHRAGGVSEAQARELGCDPSAPAPECRLRITDTLQTCNGCHALDPDGNVEFEVYRPGFFGTSGEYALVNESQVFKVPHLRNVYQKVGMFGMSTMATRLPESVLGPRRGGFFGGENRYQGPQVRGYGMLHDGAVDTLERFHGALLFVKTDDNPDAFDAVFPRAATRAACVDQFRQASPDVLGPLDAGLRAELAACSAESGIPDACFLDPSSETCLPALATLSIDPETFTTRLLSTCFQFGSMLERGSPSGVCAPSGLRERIELESFLLAYDSNLQPMVGQQTTLHGNAQNGALRGLVSAAARGHCDLALRQSNRGYLVVQPNAEDPNRSKLASDDGRRTTLRALRRDAAPITLTCYPPFPDRAEARRSAFDAR